MVAVFGYFVARGASSSLIHILSLSPFRKTIDMVVQLPFGFPRLRFH